MEWKMNPNAVNQFSKGDDIYTEGEPVFSVGMIVKGRVLIHNAGANLIMGSGAFLGINDLFPGQYQSTYTAIDDLMLYIFPISRIDELDTILSFNKDYHGFMVASFYKMIYDLDQIYQGLLKQETDLFQFLTETYHDYMESMAGMGITGKESERISSLELPENDIEVISDRIKYYCECRNLPMEVVKAFFSHGDSVTMYQIEDQADIVNQQMEALKDMAEAFVAMAGCLVDGSDACLFNLIIGISSEMNNICGVELLDIMDSIIERINKAETFAEKTLGIRLKVDRKMMEEGYHKLLTGNMKKESRPESKSEYSREDADKALAELKDAYDKILDYAEIDGDKAEEMKSAMSSFVQLKEKTSTDDGPRKIRRRVTENHYEIYYRVFVRAYKEKNHSRLIDLFLKYGFADDRLLNNEQMLSLYFLKEEEPTENECCIYDMKSWLTLIYEGKREPSKNEFDLEYFEELASEKRQGRLTEKDVKVWMSDPDKKLKYEIDNMFRYNNRTTSGQIMSFVPVLYEDQWSNNIQRLLVTPSKVNEAVADIMKIDYSVFDRELLYANAEKNIVKEYIMKRVYPDIVLMPNIGTNGVMWQEITGKRRDSAGRFFLPIFTDSDLRVMLVKQFGRFRWELCRTIEGASWNDIKQKSLTSEYSDYLQFYKKNKELSEERKDRVKSQIQKARNSSREVFVMDYENWINYEARGALKLNKPVREVMATYCPFSKELREKLMLQPLFQEAMVRYHRNKMKKIREVEGRFRMLQKDSIDLTPELEYTMDFYKNM